MNLFKLLKLFNGAEASIEKWRSRALLIDMHKTKITIRYQAEKKHLPTLVHKRLRSSVEDVPVKSLVGNEYGTLAPSFLRSA